MTHRSSRLITYTVESRRHPAGVATTTAGSSHRADEPIPTRLLRDLGFSQAAVEAVADGHPVAPIDLSEFSEQLGRKLGL